MPIPTTYTWPLIPPTPPITPTGTAGTGIFVGTGSNQSAIREGGDQIFLDTADANRLNAVTANLGLYRPIAGHTDDEWRAVAKQVMLKPKMPHVMLERVLEVCLGPRYSRASNLIVPALINSAVLEVNDASVFVQTGEMVLDKGTAIEETVNFSFADVVGNGIYLTSPLKFTHSVTAQASSFLRATANVGATSLLLRDSTVFPTSGFPYSVLLDQGSTNEEMVLITANNIVTNTLTCSVLAKQHLGPTSLYLKKNINVGTPAKRNFLTFAAGQTRVFPATGWIRINKGQANEEVQSYNTNDITNNVLMLDSILAFSHVVTEPVDLVNPGCSVQTASVLQQGAYWDLFETTPRKVYIYVPTTIQTLRLIDASYLHNTVTSAFSTTLSSNVTPASTILPVASTSGFPDEGGLVIIGGSQIVFYIERKESLNQLILDRALGFSFSSGTSVAVYTVPYGGTSLEDGNMRTAPGVRQFDHFSGPYIYDRREDGPGIHSSTVSSLLPNPTLLMADSKATRSSLEVVDVSLWSGLSFPFNIVVGRDSGFQETVSAISVVLKKDITPTTVSGTNSAGSTTLNVVAGGTYPNSGTVPYGYRLRINKNTATEEFVRVSSRSGNVFTLESGLVFTHLNTEPVDVVNDIIITASLANDHAGPVFAPAKIGQTVEPLITQIPVVDGTQFPTTAGTVWINFGKELQNARSKVVSGSGTSYVLVDTSKFPTTNYPYEVFFGKGLFTEEKVFVTNNNTGTNTLTLQGPGTINSHSADENVEYESGDPETIDYSGVSGNNLLLAAPVSTAFKHLVGERVELSSGPSVPRIDGFGYDFKLPPDPAQCYTTTFDLIRAAGVQIITVNKR